MKLISSLQEMKKEYAPVFIYSSSPEIGSIKSVVNSAKGILKINSKEYNVTWFSAFNPRSPSPNIGNDILMDIILDSNHSATGKVKVTVLTEDSDKISISGDIETPVTSGNAGSTISKRINIKFSKPISNHSAIEVRFFDDTKVSTSGYIGEIIGLLNIYKNDIEYKLNVQYVNVKFKGKIDNIPCSMTLSTGVTKLNTLINFNRKDVTLTNPSIPSPTVGNGIATISKTSILNSTSLETYVKL